MEKVKFGIVGLNRGGTLGKKMQFCTKAELTAVCDIDHAKADQYAAANGNPQVFYSLEEILASDIEAVILATPIPDHVNQVIQALEAGKHVLSEVTAATTMADCHRLAEAIKKSGKKYMMEENYCYYRPLTIVENMIKAGLFGEIYYAESDYLMDFQQRAGFPDSLAGNWRKDVYFGRRGHPYITHTLGPLAQIMGEKIKTVTCMGAGHFRDLKADNTCVLMCQTEKGNMIRLRNSFVSARPDLYTYYSLQGTKGCYQGPQGPTDFHKVYIKGLCKLNEWKNVFDFKGFLPPEWDLVPEDAYNDAHDNGTSLFDSGTTLLLEAFAHAIQHNTEPPVNALKALNWTATGILSESSIENGSIPIEVPDFEL